MPKHEKPICLIIQPWHIPPVGNLCNIPPNTALGTQEQGPLL